MSRNTRLQFFYATALAFVIAIISSPAFAQQQKQQQPKGPKLTATQTAVYVTNMHCATCAKKIARKLYSLKGVVRVGTNVKTNLAVVTPQRNAKISHVAIWNAVKSAEFEPVKLIGPDGVFVPNQKTKAPQKIAEAPKPTRR